MRLARIILATQNYTKIQHIRKVFEGSDLTLATMSEVGITGQAVEDGTTLEENAHKKAMFVHRLRSGWIIAVDTGLKIDALRDLKEVHSDRWAGEHKSPDERIHFVLDRMELVPEGARGATFTTVAIVMSPTGISQPFIASLRGSILANPVIGIQPNRQYGRIFVPKGCTKALAEMAVEEELAQSHHGQAFWKVRQFLEQM